MINRKGCYTWPTLDFVPFGNHYMNAQFNWFSFNWFNFNFKCFNVQIIKSRHSYLMFIRSCSISRSSANATRKIAQFQQPGGGRSAKTRRSVGWLEKWPRDATPTCLFSWDPAGRSVSVNRHGDSPKHHPVMVTTGDLPF